jgi:hypothetical protein
MCLIHFKKNKDLVTVPTNISSDESFINLIGNIIPRIVQSDFNDKFPNITTLWLGHNSITTVEAGSFSGTAIVKIGFTSNLLTSFPDLSQGSLTVEEVLLGYNRISHILAEDVKDLTQLKILIMNENPLVTITDQFAHIASLSVLNVEDTQPLCCCNMAWLKDISKRIELHAGRATCSHGTSLEGKEWNDVDRAELNAVNCPNPGTCVLLLSRILGMTKTVY